MKTFFLLLLLTVEITSQIEPGFQIARVKYDGGGDWYNDPSAEVNLLNFINDKTNIKVKPEYTFVELDDPQIFNYPVLFLTGHGNISFSDSEISSLREYILSGGFLYVDDDYGIDSPFRREIKKIFPEKDLVEIPYSHGIFNVVFDFPNGTPKTHEHDNKSPQTFGIFIGERLSVLYTFESNPSDGWADKEIHNNSDNIREEALKFGTNIIVWALTN
ncbi:MAG: hypothetical protein CMF23_01970 [Ignavibacteriae bacterium]|nr:hypothetical protein [Ignavibacteriota bacterium]